MSGRHNTDEQRGWAPGAAAAAALTAVTPPAALAGALGCAAGGYLTDRVELAATGAIVGGIGLAAERWSSRTLRRRLRRERAQFRWETQSLQASVDELRRELTQVMQTLEDLRSTAHVQVPVTGGMVVADRVAMGSGQLFEKSVPAVSPELAVVARATAGHAMAEHSMDETREIGLVDLDRFAQQPASPQVPGTDDSAAGPDPAACADPTGSVGPALPAGAQDPARSADGGPPPVVVLPQTPAAQGSDWFAFRPAAQTASPDEAGTPGQDLAPDWERDPDTMSLFQPVQEQIVGPGAARLFQPPAERATCEADTASTPLPLLMPGPRAAVFSPPYGMSLLAAPGGQGAVERPRELILPDSAAWVHQPRGFLSRNCGTDTIVRNTAYDDRDARRSTATGSGPALDRLANQEETGEILVVGAGTSVSSLTGALSDRRGRHLA